MIKNDNSLYQKDFYAWTIKNAELLKHGKFNEIDVENIAEEIESMGRREKRQLVSRLSVLLAHLLKWQFQPKKRTRSWTLTIKEQRRQLHSLLKESPSLNGYLKENYKEAYEDAIIIASDQTGILEYDFPDRCSFSFEDALNLEYLPD